MQIITENNWQRLNFILISQSKWVHLEPFRTVDVSRSDPCIKKGSASSLPACHYENRGKEPKTEEEEEQMASSSHPLTIQQRLSVTSKPSGYNCKLSISLSAIYEFIFALFVWGWTSKLVMTW